MDKATLEKVLEVINYVYAECQRAREKHPPLHSTHEAHSVIREELEEWWDGVKADKPDDSELIQVAAMAVMAVVELEGKNVNPSYKHPSHEHEEA